VEPPVSRRISSLCVYCGSSPGNDPAFATAATELGSLLARRQIGLVYGGGHVGLMGVLADAVLAAGGSVHGVITRRLADHEVAHQGLTSLDIVETMHQRKAAMADRADAFAMLPGGFGTLDEFFEAVTWTQLGIHTKPCGVLNVARYFDPLCEMLESAADQRFLRPQHRALVIVEPDPTALLDRLEAWTPAPQDKWLDRSDR
jgi:uncharacterized protein (TIGR00730 family)